MAPVPAIFVATVDWAQARPFGCVVGQAMRDILAELTGPPRVAACTLAAVVPMEIPGVVAVPAPWPVAQPGVDVCFLVHPGELPARVQSRMASGPVVFIHTRSPAEISPDLIDPELLIDARATALAGELEALALRHPGLAAELRSLALLRPPAPVERRRRVAVIGPDPAACAQLRTALGDFRVVDSADVDAVVAVAPDTGWSLTDVPTLLDAQERGRRLLSTAPLPAGSPPAVVARSVAEVPALLARLLDQPAVVVAPELARGQVQRALGILRQREIKYFQYELSECTQTSQLVDMAERWELGPLPARGVRPLVEVLMFAGLSVAAIARLAWPLSPALAILAGTLAAGMVAVLRWRSGERQWVRGLAAELRRRWDEPDITSGHGGSPSGWMKQQLSLAE
ncbi:hypothetical protein [Corynebacterium sp. A21]|uniref:hypothetical protein n=1 Tax=Corynebacterium sp. A21 TaxID=3457318 RepID=UPI003FD1DE33